MKPLKRSLWSIGLVLLLQILASCAGNGEPLTETSPKSAPDEKAKPAPTDAFYDDAPADLL